MIWSIGNSECMRKLLRSQKKLRQLTCYVCNSALLIKKLDFNLWSFFSQTPIETSEMLTWEGLLEQEMLSRGMAFQDSILFQRSPPKYVESNEQSAKRRFRLSYQFFWMHRVTINSQKTKKNLSIKWNSTKHNVRLRRQSWFVLFQSVF